MLLLDDSTNVAGKSYWDLAMQGGWIMIVLAVLSVLAIYIFIDKYLSLKKAGKNPILVSKDINCRIKADALGIQAEDYETNKIDIAFFIPLSISGSKNFSKLERGLEKYISTLEPLLKISSSVSFSFL